MTLPGYSGYPGGYSAQFGTPQSAITGKPMPSTEEKFYFGKALAKYLYGNLMGIKDPNPEVPFQKDFGDQIAEQDWFAGSVIDAPKDLLGMLTLGEVDPPGIGGIRKGAKAIAKGQKPVSASFKPGPGFKKYVDETIPDGSPYQAAAGSK